jgi:hypothetical protein
MKYHLLIIALFCNPIFSAINNPTVNSRLLEADSYDANRLTQAFYNNLPEVTANDEERLARFIAAVGNAQIGLLNGLFYFQKTFGLLLLETVAHNRPEDFKLLFPLLEYGDANPYDIFLMIECVEYGRMSLIEFMMSFGFDASRFIKAIKVLMSELTSPGYAIELVEWIAQRDATIAEMKCWLYSDAMEIVLHNDDVGEEELMQLAKRLIDLGADVTESLITAYKQAYPENETLIELLTNNQLPDVKGTECLC